MESRRGVSNNQARSLYWLVAIYFQLSLLVESSQDRRLQQASRQRRLQPYTDSTNIVRHGPAVNSFQVSDGNWVDCVPIEQQIASHHPTLKDHIIQMSPSSYMDLQQNHVEAESWGLHSQLFAREHGGCPESCIPVQRRDPKQPILRKFEALQQQERIPHEYAATMQSSKGPYQGASAVLSVNRPQLGKPKLDYSISQLWLLDSEYNDMNTIEVGWQVGGWHDSGQQGSHSYPQLKKLPSPHLFVYWTADSYNTTGCYDLTCPGFVQINRKWVLGATLNISTRRKEQEISLVVAYDSAIPGWWLSISGTTIGYWPSSLYTALNSSATNIQWGGEVHPASNKATGMSSGAFLDKGYPLAAYQRCVKYADSSKTFFNATLEYLAPTNPNCYNISFQQGSFTSWGSYFYFGGPGCIKHT
ncbi:hypothetical protein O6H91_21G021400 [Diphasiastrum complanatum]|uniref:Uncharacterized protein n=1 Tax=Diphasiastrum complanatum TaxID=34168 RepID=A0ACC2AIK7_DIPCM|nr:hypothetical protein O6H91_21G021400 [Diphasiastrum complanatum]